jgi:hypothetical protein
MVLQVFFKHKALLQRLASFLLVLCHVPFTDVELFALVALEWLDFVVFSQMHFQVASCVVFLSATGLLTFKFIKVLMGTLVISQDPLLTELTVAAWEGAFELLDVLLVVSCYVVRQMLRHLERFVAAFKRTLV